MYYLNDPDLSCLPCALSRRGEWLAARQCHHHHADSHKHDQMVPPDSIFAVSSVDGNGSSLEVCTVCAVCSLCT